MITTNTPDKLAQIIRDTWPQLYRPHKKNGKEKKIKENPYGEYGQRHLEKKDLNVTENQTSLLWLGVLYSSHISLLMRLLFQMQ